MGSVDYEVNTDLAAGNTSTANLDTKLVVYVFRISG